MSKVTHTVSLKVDLNRVKCFTVLHFFVVTGERVDEGVVCFPSQVGTVWAVLRQEVGRRQHLCCQCCRNCQRTRTASSAWCSLQPGQSESKLEDTFMENKIHNTNMFMDLYHNYESRQFVSFPDIPPPDSGVCSD